jgi:hypothetical protein
MLEASKKYGIYFHVTARSTYFPGHSLAVEWSKKENRGGD